MLREYRKLGKRVGGVAVDPYALHRRRDPRDRAHAGAATDPGVFIRSMASRGHLGGLAAATPQGVRVLEAAGLRVVLIETVGVGQAEVEIASRADTMIVLLAPGWATPSRRRKRGSSRSPTSSWSTRRTATVPTPPTRDPRMIALAANGPRRLEAADRPHGRGSRRRGHRRSCRGDRETSRVAESGELRERRDTRAAAEIESIALASLRVRLEALRDGHALSNLASDVASGDIDAFRAADRLLTMLGESTG